MSKYLVPTKLFLMFNYILTSNNFMYFYLNITIVNLVFNILNCKT
jgi:hypothetical protein